VILDALADAFPGVQIARDARTATSLDGDDLAALLAHRSGPLDCFDAGLVQQLAIVDGVHADYLPAA
jgi:hypothetical protein